MKMTKRTIQLFPAAIALLVLLMGSTAAVQMATSSVEASGETTTPTPITKFDTEAPSPTSPPAPACDLKTHFECHDYFSNCIPKERVCDGQWDCAEGQDEANCSEDVDHDWVPTDAEFDEEGWLICSNKDDFRCETDGKCIKKELLCNGRKDCSDGSDEGSWCGGCEDAGCSNLCENTPNGPRCLCPAMMRLSVDEKTCQFDSHCSANSKCSHNCIDSIDRLKCVCVDGYDLQSDGLTCSAGAKYRKGRLFFSKDGNSIQVTELFPEGGNAAATVVKDLPSVHRLPPADRITSMAYDRNADQLYYVVNSSPRQSDIMSVNASDPAAKPKSLMHGHGIKHIAHDWVTNNLYYAADGIGIGVCSANGKYCRHLITVPRHEEGELAQHYVDLIVHPRRGLLFWSEINADHPTGVLMAAGLDGSKRRAIGHPPAQRLKAISLDYVRDELYTLETDGLLAAYDLRALMKHPKDTGGSGAGKAMIHFDGWRYFFDASKEALVKQLMSKPQEVRTLSPIQGDQTAITIDNELYYDSVENPCPGEECSHLCVLKEGGGAAVCLCPDKYLRDDYSGACSFNENSGDGPVRTSMLRAQELCSSGEICHSGQCDFDWDGMKTVACKCVAGHSGLYCEIEPSTTAMVQSASSSRVLRVFLFLLFVSLAIGGGYYCVSKHRPEWIDQAYDFFDFSGGAQAGFDPYHVSPFKAQQASSTSGEEGSGPQLQPREGGVSKQPTGGKVSYVNPTFSQGSPSAGTKQKAYPLVDFVSVRPSTADSGDGSPQDLLDV